MSAVELLRYDLRRAAEARREWCDYHRRMIAFHEGEAARHREQRGRLIDSAAKEERAS